MSTPTNTVCIDGRVCADYTAVYLASGASIAAVVAGLDTFSSSSGLQINCAKSFYISFGEGSRFSVLAPGNIGGYLGVIIGEAFKHAENRAAFSQTTGVRLALGRTKTHIVIQRIQLVRALVLPKMCFVAEFDLPDDAMQTGSKTLWITSSGENETVSGINRRSTSLHLDLLSIQAPSRRLTSS